MIGFIHIVRLTSHLTLITIFRPENGRNAGDISLGLLRCDHIFDDLV